MKTLAPWILAVSGCFGLSGSAVQAFTDPCDRTSPGDLDGDGDVDSEDLDLMRGCRTRAAVPVSGGCAIADLDGDGDVDLSDFGLWQQDYAGHCESPLEVPPRRCLAEPCGCAGGMNGYSESPNPAHNVSLANGEFHLTVTDLRIKAGFGPDVVWARINRSRLGKLARMGNWSDSYDIKLEPLGNHLRLTHNARDDVFRLQPNGTWQREQFFWVITQNPDNSYKCTFPDSGFWEFKPLDGSPAAGRISRIVDRNANTIQFLYSGQGRLVTVRDTHGRDITLAYNADGYIESVTDFTSRQFRYVYYQDGDAGGPRGALKSMTTPAVPGFPNGKTTTYTYSKGQPEAALNYNLLTITNPDGQTYLHNEYAATTNPADPSFDRVVRQHYGNIGDVIDMTYEKVTPGAANNNASLLAITNDQNGHVCHYFYDDENRQVMVCCYTGVADPDQPTTTTTNRPTNPLRSTDPVCFETRREFNADALCTRLTEPEGNEHLYQFDSANTNRRAQGNLLSHCQTPGPRGAEQAQLCETFTYEEGFGQGCCGVNFVKTYTDPAGHTKTNTFDTRGNLLQTVEAIPNVIKRWEYDALGRQTAYFPPGNGRCSPPEVHVYFNTGAENGYLQKRIIDASHASRDCPEIAENITTEYVVDALGRVAEERGPRQTVKRYVWDALDRIQEIIEPDLQTPSGTLNYTTRFTYSGNDDITSIDRSNLLEDGSIKDNNPFLTENVMYGVLHEILRVEEEIDSSHVRATVYTYDAKRLLTAIINAQGTSSETVISIVPDERDLEFRRTRGFGTPNQSTTLLDYNGNGKVVRRVEGLEDTGPCGPHITTTEYDGYDRVVRTTDSMGNVMTRRYDADSNLVLERVDGGYPDVPGSGDNTRLSEVAYTYDALNRLIRQEVEFFEVIDQNTQNPVGDGKSITQYTYHPDSSRASVTNDNNHTTTYEQDNAGRLRTITDAKGNTTEHEYDGDNNLVRITRTDKSDIGGPDEVFVTLQGFDTLNRLISRTDSSFNTVQYGFDSLGNVTLTTDARGNKVHHTYNGLRRLTLTARDMTSTGTGSGTLIGQIRTSQGWDDADRLVSQTDDAGNATIYTYDALDRRIMTVYADGTSEQTNFDAHHNAIQHIDGNGTIAQTTFDCLGRPIHRTIQTAPGVSPSAPEDFEYDGLSRMLLASTSDAVVRRRYTSHSHMTRDEIEVAGIAVGVTSTVYDGVGNVLQSTYPGGRVITCTYDALERKKTITHAGTPVAEYFYVGPDRVTRRDYSNGTRCEYTYDGILPNPSGDFGSEQIVRTKHSVIASGSILDDRTYTWDAAQNKTQRKDVRLGGPRSTHNYAYDSASRLIRSDKIPTPPVSVDTVTYSLDDVGNRISVTGGPDAGAYSMSSTLPEPADRQMNQYTNTPFDSRTQDRNGNLIMLNSGQPSEARLRYNYRNQLVEYQLPNGDVSFMGYDHFGRRIKTQVSDSSGFHETLFFYSGNREVEEKTFAGTTQATYVWGLYIDELLLMRRGTQHYYYHQDDNHNVMAVTDGAGGVAERYEYKDFGQPSISDSAGVARAVSAIGNAYLFTGRRSDPMPALYCYRNRYLDPRAGRFITRDLIGQWGDESSLGNAYTYAGNDAWSRLDPTGTKPITEVYDRCLQEACSHVSGEWRETWYGMDCFVSGSAAEVVSKTADFFINSQACGPWSLVISVFGRAQLPTRAGSMRGAIRTVNDGLRFQSTSLLASAGPAAPSPDPYPGPYSPTEPVFFNRSMGLLNSADCIPGCFCVTQEGCPCCGPDALPWGISSHAGRNLRGRSEGSQSFSQDYLIRRASKGSPVDSSELGCIPGCFCVQAEGCPCCGWDELPWSRRSWE